MSDKSAIEWCEATWNPVTGCSKVSPGCAHCYAETLSLRFGRSRLPWTPENAAENVVLHPERLAYRAATSSDRPSPTRMDGGGRDEPPASGSDHMPGATPRAPQAASAPGTAPGLGPGAPGSTGPTAGRFRAVAVGSLPSPRTGGPGPIG